MCGFNVRLQHFRPRALNSGSEFKRRPEEHAAPMRDLDIVLTMVACLD